MFFNAKDKQALNQNCTEVALTRFCDAVTRFGLLAYQYIATQTLCSKTVLCCKREFVLYIFFFALLYRTSLKVYLLSGDI